MLKTLTLLSILFVTLHAQAQLISATGSLSVPRMEHQSQLLTNGKVLAFGGTNGNYLALVFYNSAELYNPTSGTWSGTGAMHQRRATFASVVLDNGDVLAIGGNNGSTSLASCEIYSVSAGTWSYTDSMADAQEGHFALRLDNGKILVAGYGTDCELYDQTTHTWSATGAVPASAYDGTMAKLNDGKVLLTSGSSTTAWLYDPTAGTWSTVSHQMTMARDFANSITMSNGKVLIAGGSFTQSSEVYDPATQTFTASNNETDQYHSSCPMINLANGDVLIYGIGDIFGFTNRKALESYHVASGMWSIPGVVPVSVFSGYDYTIHKLSNGKILLVGGNFTTGNGANANCYLVTESLLNTGVENISEDKIMNIYPNPTDGEFIIDAGSISESNASIKIFNAEGRTVFEGVLDGNQLSSSKEIGIPKLEAGSYTIQITGSKGVFIKKLVLE